MRIIKTRYYYFYERMYLRKWHQNWAIAQSHKARMVGIRWRHKDLPQVPLLWIIITGCFHRAQQWCIMTRTDIRQTNIEIGKVTHLFFFYIRRNLTELYWPARLDMIKTRKQKVLSLVFFPSLLLVPLCYKCLLPRS